MRQRIRLTEEDLHRIVKESVKRVLREYDEDEYDSDASEYLENHPEDSENDY
jgi:hypothetical protein